MAADGRDAGLRLHEGTLHFNAAEYWEAHESWESVWLVSTGAPKQFLQGLIQAAAAWHQLRRGQLRGAGRLAVAALARLSNQPSGYFGVERGAVCAALAVMIRELPDLERVVRTAPELVLERDWQKSVQRDWDAAIGSPDPDFVNPVPHDQEG